MKKIKLILTAIAILSAAYTVSAQTANDVNIKYNEAAELLQQKKYAEAIPLLEAVIEMGLEAGPDASVAVTNSQKTLPSTYLRVAAQLSQAGKFEEALPIIDKAIELGELYGVTNAVNSGKRMVSQVYMAMGASAFNNKEYDKAIEIFSKGYEANPSDTELALYLAESYGESQDYANAAKVYDNIIALEARHSRYKEPAEKAREKLTYYLTQQVSEIAKTGNKAAAYQILDELLEVDSNNAIAHMIRIQTATNAQDYNKVIEWGEAAAAAQAGEDMKSNVYYFMGAAYQNTDRVSQAVATYRKVTAGDYVAAAKEQIALLNK